MTDSTGSFHIVIAALQAGTDRQQATAALADALGLDPEVTAVILRKAPITLFRDVSREELGFVRGYLDELRSAGIELTITREPVDMLPKVNWPEKPDLRLLFAADPYTESGEAATDAPPAGPATRDERPTHSAHGGQASSLDPVQRPTSSTRAFTPAATPRSTPPPRSTTAADTARTVEPLEVEVTCPCCQAQLRVRQQAGRVDVHAQQAARVNPPAVTPVRAPTPAPTLAAAPPRPPAVDRPPIAPEAATAPATVGGLTVHGRRRLGRTEELPASANDHPLSEDVRTAPAAVPTPTPPTPHAAPASPSTPPPPPPPHEPVTAAPVPTAHSSGRMPATTDNAMSDADETFGGDEVPAEPVLDEPHNPFMAEGLGRTAPAAQAADEVARPETSDTLDLGAEVGEVADDLPDLADEVPDLADDLPDLADEADLPDLGPAVEPAWPLNGLPDEPAVASEVPTQSGEGDAEANEGVTMASEELEPWTGPARNYVDPALADDHATPPETATGETGEELEPWTGRARDYHDPTLEAQKAHQILDVPEAAGPDVLDFAFHSEDEQAVFDVPSQPEPGPCTVYLNKIKPSDRGKAVTLMQQIVGLDPDEATKLAQRLVVPVLKDVSEQTAADVLSEFNRHGLTGRIRKSR